MPREFKVLSHFSFVFKVLSPKHSRCDLIFPFFWRFSFFLLFFFWHSLDFKSLFAPLRSSSLISAISSSLIFSFLNAPPPWLSLSLKVLLPHFLDPRLSLFFLFSFLFYFFSLAASFQMRSSSFIFSSLTRLSFFPLFFLIFFFFYFFSAASLRSSSFIFLIIIFSSLARRFAALRRAS